MSSIEIIALIVTIVCLVSFSIVFTVLFRHYYKSNMATIESGEEDLALIDYAIEEEKAKKKKSKKVIRISLKVLSYFIFGVILIFFGISLYSRFSNNVMPFGDTSLIVIATGSMSEVNDSNDYIYEHNLNNQFNAYDIISISKYKNQEEIDLYDVIAFKNDDGDTIVHRITEIITLDSGEEVYITRGDANAVDDTYNQYSSYLSYDAIIGKYNGFRIPGIGIFVIFLQSNAGIITIIAIAYCLFMFDFYNARYENLITERTNKLVELLDYDLEKNNIDELNLIYKEELIYQNNIYTFIKGEFVSKEEIKDENTLKKINDYLVFIKTQDEKVDKNNIFIRNVSTNETKKIEDVGKKEIKNIINQEIPDDNLNNIDN